MNFLKNLYKCYHIWVAVKDISNILTVMNSWDAKQEVRMSFSKIILKKALSDIFEKEKSILCDSVLTTWDKKK